MKKQALLLLIVLGISTTAWGSFAYVTVPPCTPCGEQVCINVKACIPYDCEIVGTPLVCVRGHMVVVDICYNCLECACGGKTVVGEDVCVDLCPGVYSVLVRVSVDCDCWSFGPRVSAIGSAFFKVGFCEPCPPSGCPSAPSGGCCSGGDGIGQ
jgi:hypothetical protein